MIRCPKCGYPNVSGKYSCYKCGLPLEPQGESHRNAPASSEAIPFDLNVERVLDHWTVAHALREIIANALDEQVLSGTADVSIRKDNLGQWNIRDFGRGLRIDHFTQNESPEKTDAPCSVIGRYGVGLKDALAVLHRNSTIVNARSRNGFFRLRCLTKSGFGDITTLHVEYTPRNDSQYTGTVFVLAGVDDGAVRAAMDMFIRFRNEELVSRTPYGEILRPSAGPPRVYICGVAVNEEPGFLFSYNVTSVTPSMRARIGRERVSVGRSVYADRVKEILLQCEDAHLWDSLADEVWHRQVADTCDELQWLDVRAKALGRLHDQRAVVYVTSEELAQSPSLVDSARRENRSIVTVSEVEKQRLVRQNTESSAGNVLLQDYADEYRNSFQYSFLPTHELANREQQVLALKDAVVALVSPGLCLPVLVSSVLRSGIDDPMGAWDAENQRIIVHRNALASPEQFVGVLLHELAHALTGLTDVSRDFESELTRLMGVVGAAYCRALGHARPA